jgi:cytochrome b pre-mRNA-processing protein 3
MVSSEFLPKQAVLMAHIWMVHKRLMSEGDAGRKIQECLFDEMWEDTSARLRADGINELSINKYLEEVQGYSFKLCVEMDEALSKGTRFEVLDEMGGR